MSRRAQAELVVSILRVLVIGLLALLLTIQLGFFTGMRLESGELEAELVTARLLAAVTEDHRLLPFDEKRLADAYLEEGEKRWGGRVRLYGSRAALEAGLPEREAWLAGDEVAGRLIDLAAAGARGPGSGDYRRTLLPVIDGSRTAWLEVEVVKRT